MWAVSQSGTQSDCAALQTRESLIMNVESLMSPSEKQKNPGGHVMIRLNDTEWQTLIRLKHRMEVRTGRPVTITDVFKTALSYTDQGTMGEVPAPPDAAPEVPAVIPMETSKPKKKRNADKPKIRTRY